MKTKPRLLLTSVFGPYGIDDAYGRSDNKMELFHNQVTREQGVFSYRFHHSSFGLFFLAENLQTSTRVLDFPTREEFSKEVLRGYDYIGISFIMPNFAKAKAMAEMIRKLAPETRIVLGGHGTAVPGVESLIPHDHLCKGEGISFLRELLGEECDRPIRHPIMYSSYNRMQMGVPIRNGSGILIPGVGCPNKCRFCATSHFFGGYTPYLESGQDIYDVCASYESELGVTDFGVLDENFLKERDRALDLLALMERDGRRWTFGIFSSAETLQALGDLDLLVRLGVSFVWMGVESKDPRYEKNQGTDFASLVADLRRRGISVMASTILFAEHHDHDTIWQDVDFTIGLQPDYIQFMQLGPIPGTALWNDYEEQKLLCDPNDVPWGERHGQDKIWFRHHAFSREETRTYLRDAFRRDYSTHGAAFHRVIDTALRGHQYASTHADTRIQFRAPGLEAFALMVRPFMLASTLLAQNAATTDLVRRLRREYRDRFGRPGFKDMMLSVAVTALALVERGRLALRWKARQPPRLMKDYRVPGNGDAFRFRSRGALQSVRWLTRAVFSPFLGSRAA